MIVATRSVVPSARSNWKFSRRTSSVLLMSASATDACRTPKMSAASASPMLALRSRPSTVSNPFVSTFTSSVARPRPASARSAFGVNDTSRTSVERRPVPAVLASKPALPRAPSAATVNSMLCPTASAAGATVASDVPSPRTVVFDRFAPSASTSVTRPS